MAFPNGPLTSFMSPQEGPQIQSSFMPQNALSAPTSAEQLSRLSRKVAPDEEGSSLSLIKQAKDRLLAQSTGVDPLISWLAAYGSADPRNKLGAAAQAMTQAVGQQDASKQKLDLDVLQLDMAAAEKRENIAARAVEKTEAIAARDREKEEERIFKAEEAVKSDERDFDNQVILANMLSESRLDVARITAAPRLEAAANKKPASIEAQDKFYATDLAKWTLNGKGVAAEQLSKLDEVTTLLEQNTDVSGKFVGLLPRYVRSQASKNAEDLIGSIVQSDLRQILGGQFAQREGENLLKRAYAIDVGEPDNLQRVKRLKTRILSAIEAKNEMADYFDEHETMQGYKGKTVDDIYQEMKKELETVKEPVAPNASNSGKNESFQGFSGTVVPNPK